MKLDIAFTKLKMRSTSTVKVAKTAKKDRTMTVFLTNFLINLGKIMQGFAILDLDRFCLDVKA